MAQYDETEAYWVGENRQMIAYKGELYSSLLPRECVFEPIEGTGPIDCKTCKQVGFWNGLLPGSLEFQHRCAPFGAVNMLESS